MKGTTKPRRRWVFTRREFHVASAISLLLVVGLLILDDASRSSSWRVWMPQFVTRWEMHFDDGDAVVLNNLEWVANQNRISAALAEAQKAYSWEQSRLRNLPGTANETAAALHRAELQLNADWERILASPDVPRRRHVMPIWGLSLVAAILPMAWVVRWLAIRPYIRRELIRPAGVVSCVLALITLAMFVAAMHSYFVAAMWQPRPTQIKQGIRIARPELVWGQFAEIVLINGRVSYFHYRSWFIPGKAESIFLYNRGGNMFTWRDAKADKTAGDQTVDLPGVKYILRGYDATLSARSVAKLYINVSCWLLILAWLVLTLPWWRYFVRRVRAAYRRQEGRCATCGYSAVGNSTGICSECGSKLEVAAKGGKSPVSVGLL